MLESYQWAWLSCNRWTVLKASQMWIFGERYLSRKPFSHWWKKRVDALSISEASWVRWNSWIRFVRDWKRSWHRPITWLQSLDWSFANLVPRVSHFAYEWHVRVYCTLPHPGNKVVSPISPLRTYPDGFESATFSFQIRLLSTIIWRIRIWMF